ncbi:hypothetical protein SMNI109538_12655 [Smaragdicoccus niigatensis]
MNLRFPRSTFGRFARIRSIGIESTRGVKLARTTYAPRGTSGFHVTLLTKKGNRISVETLPDSEPEVGGDVVLKWNPQLSLALIDFGAHERSFRRVKLKQKKDSHRAAADRAEKVAVKLSELCDLTTSVERSGWCSACWEKTDHVKLAAGKAKSGLFLCRSCGMPTSICPVPKCPHFASAGFEVIATPTFCAEHRHAIPSFDRLAKQLESIDDYQDWVTYEKFNAKRATKVATAIVSAAATVGPLAYLRAAQVGGAVGHLAAKAAGKQLFGAAAKQYGLALLGGGAVNAGGLGVAGGIGVIAAAGALIGGAAGGAAVLRFVSEDKSFRVVKLQDGEGPAVLLASGFMTERSDHWGDWRTIVEDRFPHSPVYRIFWGSKELKALVTALGVGGVKVAGAHGASFFARKALKKAAMGSLAGVFAVPGTLANPWNVAKARSEKTGTIVGDLIERTGENQYILVGHSLGARVMVTAALELGSKGGAPRIHSMHLLGGALGNDHDWRLVSDAASTNVWNYYSSNDGVLKYIYRVAGLGKKAIGLVGIDTKYPKFRNRNVSRHVAGHSRYFDGKFRLQNDA